MASYFLVSPVFVRCAKFVYSSSTTNFLQIFKRVCKLDRLFLTLVSLELSGLFLIRVLMKHLRDLVLTGWLVEFAEEMEVRQTRTTRTTGEC